MSSSPLSRLGMPARGLLSSRVAGPRRILPLCATRAPLLQANRFPFARLASSTGMSRVATEGLMPPVHKQSAPRLDQAQKMKNDYSEMSAQALSMIVPGTFILPPFSQFPKKFSEKLRFIGWWIVMKGQEFLTNTGLRYSTKRTFWTAAPLKAKRSVLIPTAKALHRTMAEALAAGDKDVINRLCSRAMAGPYIASIQSRPRGVRYGWELLGYTKKLLYPAIRSHKLSPLGKGRMAPIVRQAVVAISSKQRRVKYDPQGNVVPGSEKEIDVVEHVAISCIIDPRTWQQSDWHFIGAVKPTTYEGWIEERKVLKAMLEQS